MLLRLLNIVITTAAALASASAQPPAVFSTGETSGNLNATGTWQVSPGGGQVLVNWNCPAFEHTSTSGYETDLSVSLIAQSVSGSVSSHIVQASDTTNVVSGQDAASVTAIVDGTGLADFQISLHVDGSLPAEGTYQTIVNVTLTAP